MVAVTSMQSVDLKNKRVLIRADLNVPVQEGMVTSDARIQASLPTIKHALTANAAVVVMSHLGRPTEGEFDPQASLAPVASRLAELLGCDVQLLPELAACSGVQPGNVALLENVRFNPGEKANDEALSKQYAALCDVYVMDAFGTAHRAQASTHGAGQFAETACAGPLLAGELEALGKALDGPARPMAAIAVSYTHLTLPTTPY